MTRFIASDEKLLRRIAMKTRFTVLALLVVLLISVAVAASAISIPNVKDSGAPEPPEIPTMYTKNDGKTQTVTMSSPIDWIASIWNWEWFEMKFDNEEHTQASVSMEGHHAAQGWGIWVSSSYDADGNLTWTGTGVYGEEGHPYAYDVTLPGGTNVKYGTHGNPVEITIDDYAGSSYFDNGKSRLTKYIYKCGTNSVDKPVTYLYQLQESYADGSFIRTTYAMNGEPTYAFLMTKDKSEIVLYNWNPPEKEKPAPEPVDDDDTVIFEGSKDFKGITDWNNWADNTDHIDLSAAPQMQNFASGKAIKVTFNFPYDDWAAQDWSSGPVLIVQPTDNWVWGQFETSASDKANGTAFFSYDSIASKVDAPTTDRGYKYFNIYPLGTDITITKVEIVDK